MKDMHLVRQLQKDKWSSYLKKKGGGKNLSKYGLFKLLWIPSENLQQIILLLNSQHCKHLEKN